MKSSVLILSAGQGKRMRSFLPKGIHPVGGKPILARILQTVRQAGFEDIKVVITKQSEKLISPIIKSFKAEVVIQDSKTHVGTAGALMSVPTKNLKDYSLVINGDHPLIEAKDLKNFVDQALKEQADIAVGTCHLSDPKNMGRIVRSGDQIEKIVESYDLTEEIKNIREVNSGVMLIRTSLLEENLKLITNDNPKEEYPITDLISIVFQQKFKVIPIEVNLQTAFGVNTQEELSLANNFLFEKKIAQLMSQGVMFPSPHQVHIEEDVTVQRGSIIYPGVYLKGRTHIGAYCAIEQNCFIFDSEIGDSVYIKAHCYLEKAQIRSRSVVGPFAHLRPGAVIESGCKVGNFVEIKNTHFGSGSKASHQCYLGDSTIGKNVNIGAGTVICNYSPSKKKHKTQIQDEAFVGSGSMLVAPVEIGEQSIVAAGSVITENVPSKTLAISRTKQQNKTRK